MKALCNVAIFIELRSGLSNATASLKNTWWTLPVIHYLRWSDLITRLDWSIPWPSIYYAKKNYTINLAELIHRYRHFDSSIGSCQSPFGNKNFSRSEKTSNKFCLLDFGTWVIRYVVVKRHSLFRFQRLDFFTKDIWSKNPFNISNETIFLGI